MAKSHCPNNCVKTPISIRATNSKFSSIKAPSSCESTSPFHQNNAALSSNKAGPSQNQHPPMTPSLRKSFDSPVTLGDDRREQLLHSTMRIRNALVLALSITSLLSGCTTTSDDRHVAKVMRDRNWPRIEQIARTEVKKRESAWPDEAVYLPQEHKDKMWVVWAIAGTPNSDGQRRIALMIGDDGSVVMYKTYMLGDR
jgi:hypothetical protein